MKSVSISTPFLIAVTICILSSELIEAKSCRSSCLKQVIGCKRKMRAKVVFDMEAAALGCCNKYIECQRECGVENPSCGWNKGKRGSWNKRFEYDPFADSDLYDDLY